MLDPKVIDEVLQGFAARGGRIQDLPPPDVVHRFIEVAFFGSLKSEEGRPAHFAASLASLNEAKAAQDYAINVRVFAQPLPFTAGTIAKVGSAFDPDLSSLAVGANDAGNLEIWGVFSYRPPWDYYNSIPAALVGAAPSFRPNFLTVTVAAPGSLLFSRGSDAVGRLVSGYFVQATPIPFTSRSLGKYWLEFVKKTGPFGSHGNAYWRLARNGLEVLLDEISRRGHGGTLVLLDCTAPPPQQLYHSMHSFHTSGNVGALIINCLTHQDMIGIAYRRAALEHLQRTAQLAALDGALIVESNFNVIGFGAKLQSPPWSGKTIVGPDGFGCGGGGDFVMDGYGTRHRSARDFAAACGSSIVFVVSQDGPIRAFHKTSDSVVTCWPDCTTSMFADH
jgi:hypothetical protein